jgi:ankyrin repeat protein
MMEDLFAAIEQHDTSRVTELLAGGADPNAPEAKPLGLRPLHVAINELSFGGGLDVLLALLKHGADANAWNVKQDVTPLLLAVFEDQPAAVEVLLKAGADPNVRSSEGDRPLWVCVSRGDLSMASLLLEAGAARTINEWGGPTGYTAIGLAAKQLDIPMIKLLLDAGADPEVLDADYQNARERLPREAFDPEVWNAAFRLLQRAQGRSP